MNELEIQVREALIEQKTDQMCELLNRPKYQKMLRDASSTMVETVFDEMRKIMPDELDTSDKYEFNQMMSSEIEKVISSPDYMKQTASQSAKNTYLTREGFNDIMDQSYGKMIEEIDLDENVMEDIKKAGELLYGSIDRTTEFVDRLVKIAEDNGIENAISNETKYLVTRDMVPEKGEYIRLNMCAFESVQEYFSKIQDAVSNNTEEGELIGGFFGALKKVMNKLQDSYQSVMFDQVMEEAEKIYTT